MESHESHPSREQLLSCVPKISGNREVLLALNELLADEERGPQELVALLRLDAGLASRVIAAANTVYFRGGLPVGSIEEAVIRLGWDKVRQLLLQSMAYEMMAGSLRVYGLAAGTLWNQSLACAIAMDELGQAAHRSSGLCYTIGLLHAVGLVVVNQWLTREAAAGRATIAGPRDTWSAQERKLVGQSSAELGGALLQTWNFPASIVAAVVFQDQPLASEEFRKLSCLFVVARWLSEMVLESLVDGLLPHAPDALLFKLAGIAPDDVLQALDPVRDRFLQAREAVGLI